MHPTCPKLSSTAIISDDEFLAARLSSALAQRGSYLSVLDGPRMTRVDHPAEVKRRNNALARLRPKVTLLGGLPDDAREAMRAQLPRNHAHDVSDADVAALVVNPKILKKEPLRWGRDRIGVGLLRALYEQRLIAFDDTPSPVGAVKSPSGHLVVCEAGEPLAEVIAANYAYALNAGLCIIDETDEVERKELLEAYYSIDAPRVNSGEVRDRLQHRLRELCNGVELPPEGSLTFITRVLPFGAAFPELPSTHLISYPDLGITVVNGFAAEQKSTRGTNVAVLVDPEKVRAPEIEAAAKILPSRLIFVRGYQGKGATVRRVTEMVDLFPYDLLIFATHCGDAPGYRWTYEFQDSEGLDRRLVTDIALGVADTDDPDMLHVTHFLRFHELDGVDWTDPVAKEQLYVGTAIKDFIEQRKLDLEPVEKEEIKRVIGSAAMAMADNNYLAMPRSLAAEGSPIIINNACVSWHELSERFTFANARAYIGTLYPVSDSEAEAIVVRLLDKFFGKPLPHAVWAAQNAVYGTSGNRRPYVVTGVYPQRLRATKEDVPRHILDRFRQECLSWKKRLETVPEGEDRLKKNIETFVAYYEREIALFRKRWGV
jgi:hypothetical protein